MLTCIDVKFIFDSVLRLDLSSSVNILQTADFALRVVFLLCVCYVFGHYFAYFQL